jgi:predicted  nucleic acid-binding Zn-ribbon protein
MFEAVADLAAEHTELEKRLADPAVHADQTQARALSRRYAELTPIVEAQRRAEVERVKAAVRRVLGALSTDHARLAAEREQLRSQLQTKEAQRTALAGKIDAASLALYERLRQRLPDGIAAAEVVQNRCEGCRTTLPSAEVQRARRSEAPVQCSACGRIIHVPLG